MTRLLLSSLVLGLLVSLPATSHAQADDVAEGPAASSGDVAEGPVASSGDVEAEPGGAPASDDEASGDAFAGDTEHHNFLHGGVRLVREHAVAVGFHHTYLRANPSAPGTPDKRYNFISPSASYSFYRGHRFGFLMNLEWFFPMHGWQQGSQTCPGGCNTRRLYKKTLGYDATFMFAYHRDLRDDLSLNAGLGLHANIIDMEDASLRDFNNISMGIGSMTTLRYYINEKFDIGGNLTMSVDWADMIHQTGVLNFNINWALSATMGVHL